MAEIWTRKSLSSLQIEAAAGDSGDGEVRHLMRSLSAVNLVALGVGGIIGAGIFVLTAVAAVGTLNPKENEDLRTTDALLAPIASATGGAVQWLVDRGVPEIRQVGPDREAAGRNWLGLRSNESYFVTGVREIPLIPALLALALLLGTMVGAWYREGR